MHKHECLNCGAVVAEGDFDCDFDADHPDRLCDACVKAGVDPNDG